MGMMLPGSKGLLGTGSRVKSGVRGAGISTRYCGTLERSKRRLEVSAINWFSRSGFRALLIFFLGLNIAWMELAYNAALRDPMTMLGWPPFGVGMTAHEWFWTHFALTGLTAAGLIYSYHLWPVPESKTNAGEGESR